MSTISSIYDYLHTKVGTILSDHKELYQVDSIEKNNDLNLSLGWGVLIERGATKKRFSTCLYSIERTFVITNTIAMYGAEVDISIRKTAEKTLYENQLKIIAGMTQDNQLNGLVNDMSFVSDNGIEYVYGEFKNYLMLRSTFILDYNETIGG